MILFRIIAGSPSWTLERCDVPPMNRPVPLPLCVCNLLSHRGAGAFSNCVQRKNVRRTKSRVSSGQ